MQTTPPTPNSWPLSKPLEFLQKVKYGGVVGKKAAMGIAALLVLGIAIFAVWGKEYAVLMIVGMVFVVLLTSFLSIDKTLAAHPELALMDGSEIVRIREIEAGAAKDMTAVIPGQKPVAKPYVEVTTTLPEIEGTTV